MRARDYQPPREFFPTSLRRSQPPCTGYRRRFRTYQHIPLDIHCYYMRHDLRRYHLPLYHSTFEFWFVTRAVKIHGSSPTPQKDRKDIQRAISQRKKLKFKRTLIMPSSYWLILRIKYRHYYNLPKYIYCYCIIYFDN